MLRTDVIYRVIDSPTAFEYAYSPDGESVRTYHSSNRAIAAHGPMPLVPIPRDDFDAMIDVPTIHAHFETTATDCDGQIDRAYVVEAFPGEDDLDFHDRIVALVVNTYSLLSMASLSVVKLDSEQTRLEWSEMTEEGSRYTVAVICTREDCDTAMNTYRDHRAEEMGY